MKVMHPVSLREQTVLENESVVSAKEASVKAYFQSRAPYWNDVYRRGDVRSLRYRERLKSVLKLVSWCALPTGSHALDLGSGAGVYSVALAKRGYSVEAIDAAPAMIERTRRRAIEAQVGERVKTSVGSGYHLAFPNETFSLAIAIGVIPWLDSPQNAVAELARVIKPGGYLLLTADNRHRLDVLLDPLKSPAFSPVWKMVKGIFRISYWGWRPAPASTVYASDHSLDDVDKLLATARLGRVHAETLGFGPFTLFDHEFLPEWLGIRAHRALQYLVRLGCPGLRSAGWQIVVLARKQVPHENALENRS